MHTEDVIASAVARGVDPYLDVERNHVSTGFAVDVPAILEALSEAGLAIVPVEPTEAMLKAADKILDHTARLNYGASPSAEDYWDAMLAAAQES